MTLKKPLLDFNTLDRFLEFAALEPAQAAQGIDNVLREYLNGKESALDFAKKSGYAYAAMSEDVNAAPFLIAVEALESYQALSGDDGIRLSWQINAGATTGKSQYPRFVEEVIKPAAYRQVAEALPPEIIGVLAEAGLDFTAYRTPAPKR